MPRIAGIDLPKNKRIDIALTRIYGVGRPSAAGILKGAGVEPSIRAQDLTDAQVSAIRKVLDSGYKVEGELRKEVAMNVKRLMDINTYRGLRHKKNLPVRGQRTRTNARTRKGPRKSAVVVRKAE
ncbi:MAG: 30S ribosomal protein S13 [Deltaproteobacteria bacterium]|nr:30S ribosomal protein S13 [Deltaproteobacteria bacterium]